MQSTSMMTHVKVSCWGLTCLAEGFVVHHADDLQQPGQAQDVQPAAPQQQVQGQRREQVQGKPGAQIVECYCLWVHHKYLIRTATT